MNYTENKAAYQGFFKKILFFSTYESRIPPTAP